MSFVIQKWLLEGIFSLLWGFDGILVRVLIGKITPTVHDNFVLLVFIKCARMQNLMHFDV